MDVTHSIFECTPKGSYGNTVVRQHGVLRRFWEGFLGRVVRRGPAMGLTMNKGSKKGSQKGFREGGLQKVPRTPPLGEYNPLGVRPKDVPDFIKKLLITKE